MCFKSSVEFIAIVLIECPAVKLQSLNKILIIKLLCIEHSSSYSFLTYAVNSFKILKNFFTFSKKYIIPKIDYTTTLITDIKFQIL